MTGGLKTAHYRPITQHNIQRSAVWQRLNAEQREELQVVSEVLPFRTNSYVVDELIDWDRLPDDHIFQLTFVQRGMLPLAGYEAMRDLLHKGADKAAVRQLANKIRMELNPHPSGQLTHNVPLLDDRPLAGIQHKYRETVLFFPSQGQTCHAYCTYCFRWAQFVDLPDMRFEARDSEDLARYIRLHPEVTDVLFTGGDPMIMKSRFLRRYIEPLLSIPHLQNIRIGSKVLSYWPQRFLTDDDAEDVLRLFEEIVASGRHLAFMAHFSHPIELSTTVATRAVERVRASGAEIRLQAPIIRRVNDDAETWARLWQDSVRWGIIPYYMFVERDTGPKNYFEVPLVRAYDIFRDAYSRVSGLARSVRGPVMSAFPGKVRILGVTEVLGQRVLVCDLLQARNPDWVRQPFFAHFDPKATWFNNLQPSSGGTFFFESPPDKYPFGDLLPM